MVEAGQRTDRVVKLADELRAKVLAEAEFIGRADGKVTLEAFPKGNGYDIRLTVSTR
jgi:hypothetical protein